MVTRKVKYVLLLLLSGCAWSPYVEFGSGYAAESGDYAFPDGSPINERCVLGYYAVGAEFREGWSADLSHRSCAFRNNGNEIVTYDFLLKKRFGGRR